MIIIRQLIIEKMQEPVPKKLDASMIYTSEGDNLLLRKNFKSDENGSDNPLLLSIRSLLLGFPISKSEADVIRNTFGKQDIREAFRRKFFHVISNDTPIGKEADFWFGTDIEVRGKHPDEIRQIIESKQLCLEMFHQALGLLVDPTGPKIDISFDPKEVSDPFQVRFLARNKYIGTIVNCLVQVKMIADVTKDETKEQKKERESKNNGR